MMWFAWTALAVAFLGFLATCYVGAYELRRWTEFKSIAEKMPGGWASLWAWVRGGLR